jgi:inorganic pyrophosphatase
MNSTKFLLSTPFKLPNRPVILAINSRIQLVARHLSNTNVTMAQSRYNVRKNGPANTLEHRIYIEKDGVPVSPFHDIPLYANEQQTVLNMIVEIPRWTNGKLEVSV